MQISDKNKENAVILHQWWWWMNCIELNWTILNYTELYWTVLNCIELNQRGQSEDWKETPQKAKATDRNNSIVRRTVGKRLSHRWNTKDGNRWDEERGKTENEWWEENQCGMNFGSSTQTQRAERESDLVVGHSVGYVMVEPMHIQTINWYCEPLYCVWRQKHWQKYIDSRLKYIKWMVQI